MQHQYHFVPRIGLTAGTRAAIGFVPKYKLELQVVRQLTYKRMISNCTYDNIEYHIPNIRVLHCLVARKHMLLKFLLQKLF